MPVSGVIRVTGEDLARAIIPASRVKCDYPLMWPAMKLHVSLSLNDWNRPEKRQKESVEPTTDKVKGWKWVLEDTESRKTSVLMCVHVWCVGCLPILTIKKKPIVQRKANRIIPHPYIIRQSLSSFSPTRHTHTHGSSDVWDGTDGWMLSAECQVFSHKSVGNK